MCSDMDRVLIRTIYVRISTVYSGWNCIKKR